MPVKLLDVESPSPPPFHRKTDDSQGLIAQPGNALEPQTGRHFFLDYPADLQPGEPVTFVLSLHGGGSIGNWQRHYFPLMDLKEKYRLVIATPSGTNNGWNAEKDDAYLENIVTMLYGALGRDRIKAFWLAGHSLGGQTCNRLLFKDFYREKLTGWTSLSGGRLGSKREDVRAPIPAGFGPRRAQPASADEPPRQPARLVADASILPDFPFSFIYATGEHELTPAGLPGHSPWAEQLGGGPQTLAMEVIDAEPGYVGDTRENPSPLWGRKPRPGTARIFTYPGCRDGRLVADVLRLDKGHTEGLEPRITEEIVKMMLSVS